MLAPRVPRHFAEGLFRDFREAMRIRWSPVRNRWQIEREGREAARPKDPKDRYDTWVRCATGFYRVMEVSPGSLLTCSYCGQDYQQVVYTLDAAKCPRCGQQELVMNWPLGERLLEHLRFTDPERDGLARLWKDLETHEERVEAGQIREKQNLGEALWKDEFTRLFDIQSRGYEGPAPFWLNQPETKRFGGTP